MSEKKDVVIINGISYFTRHGAAKQLALSLSTLDRYALRKMVSCVKHPWLGKLYSQEALDSFIRRITLPAKR